MATDSSNNWPSNQSNDLRTTIAKFIFCIVSELVLGSTHYLIYLEALQLPDITYLRDVPPFNMVLGPDSELSLAHIISALFALASILIPITLWDTVITERLPEETKIFLGTMSGRIKAILLPLVYLIVIALEIAAFSVFISRVIDEMVYTGFPVDIEESSKLVEIAQNNGEAFTVLGTTVLILINAMIAWITAKTYHSIKTVDNGGLS